MLGSAPQYEDEGISRKSRAERKASVLDAIEKLRNAFPLQRRIEAAPPAVRAGYAEVLRAWLREGKPPPVHIVATPLFQALYALDAVVFDEHVLGCYPFSARDRGVHVHYVDHPGTSVHAVCALDALAIPRLSRHAARVTARCAICRCHLSIDIEASGSLEHSNSLGTRVMWQRDARYGVRSCHGICTAIEFICRYCTPMPDALTFSLPEAAAVANAFFAFQRRLLDHYERL